MNDLSNRLAAMSPEKLELLARRLSADVPAPLRRPIQRRAAADEPIPLSFAQERLWFFHKLQPDSAAYVISSSLRIKTLVDCTALRRSLEEIVRRHEVLRTTIAAIAGRPFQIVSRAGSLPLNIVDLTDRPAAQREAAAAQYAVQEGRTPFDIERGPLVRVTLLVLGRSDYLLIVSMHHIVSDGWSLNIFFRELGVLYEGFVAGLHVPLPDLPIQYADYAIWQRNWLQGSTLDRLLAYWTSQLVDARPTVEMPTDRSRNAIPTFTGSVQPLSFSRETTERLRVLAQQQGATLFMVLVSSFAILLQRYSGQDDIVIGSPIANRSRAEVESVIGFFVNMLPIRARLYGDPTFREVLTRIRETTLGAYAHQDLPFERLVEAVHPERNLSQHPIFQITFGLQTGPSLTPSATEAGAPLAEPTASGNGTAKFDLTLVFSETTTGLHGGFEYAVDLFQDETIANMARQFSILVSAILDCPDAPISRLSLLGPEEVAEYIRETAIGPSVALAESITESISTHATLRPNAPAIVSNGQVLTYADLGMLADALVGRLKRTITRREMRVGVFLDRSAELVVALLAILKVGAVYVPLDPTYPPARLRFMAEEAGLDVLVTSRALANRARKLGTNVVLLDRAQLTLPVMPAARSGAFLDDRQLAYIIFTSGSTGHPKGAMVTHGGLRSLMAAQQSVIRVRPDDRILFFSSPSFDASIFEIGLAFGAGATLYIEPRDALLPGPRFIRLVRERRVSILTIPPSALAAVPVETCPDLRTLIVAGEACSPELVRRWSSGRRFINAYGPTETAVWATAADCSDSTRPPSIGRPIPNTHVLVLDGDLCPVPPGIPGEIFIGGAGVARGYVNRPELTAERFVPHPFRKGERLYRSGDIARRRRDGNIEFVRRADEQVKIRGFRIEPGEVEVVLAHHQDVTHAAVVARKDRSGEPYLAAYVVPAPQSSVSVDKLRRYLSLWLPQYMVPSTIVFLEALPSTPSGKLDRRALPEPKAQGRIMTSTLTPLENRISHVWSDVLGIQQIGAADNFFDLGGHSLLVTQVIVRLESMLGVDIPVRSLFEGPTLTEFSATVERIVRGRGAMAAPHD